jgi:predicted nucleotidyltransferase
MGSFRSNRGRDLQTHCDSHPGQPPDGSIKDALSVSANAARAETVLRRAVDGYSIAFGERLIAAYALGSVAHGGFSASVSDVDLGLIIRDPLAPDDSEVIQLVANREKTKDIALSTRLSVFWATPSMLRGERTGGRFSPVDRMDLIENGRLIAGTDEPRLGLPRPSREELLVSGAEFALASLAGIWGEAQAVALGRTRPPADDATEEIRRPEILFAGGLRRVTKVVLFPVRFTFTASTGRIGANAAAVAWYLEQPGAVSTDLVAAALSWRDEAPVNDAGVKELLYQQLVALYLHYIDDQIKRVGAAGRPDLVRAFKEWRHRLAL